LEGGVAERPDAYHGNHVWRRLIDNATQHVPGGFSGPGTMFMIMGTSTCHMLMAENEVLVEGVVGVVEGGTATAPPWWMPS
jgi:L-ribulokinase